MAKALRGAEASSELYNVLLQRVGEVRARVGIRLDGSRPKPVPSGQHDGNVPRAHGYGRNGMPLHWLREQGCGCNARCNHHVALSAALPPAALPRLRCGLQHADSASPRPAGTPHDRLQLLMPKSDWGVERLLTFTEQVELFTAMLQDKVWCGWVRLGGGCSCRRWACNTSLQLHTQLADTGDLSYPPSLPLPISAPAHS